MLPRGEGETGPGERQQWIPGGFRCRDGSGRRAGMRGYLRRDRNEGEE